MGILMAPQCVYVLYNTGNGVLKWEYRTEVRLNAFLQHYLQGYPYNGHPQIRAIMTGTDMEMAFRLFTSTGGYKKSLFMLDTSFEHFHYLPNTPEGEVLLKLLVHPEIMEKLDNLLLSDLAAAAIQFHWNMMPRMLPGTPSFLLMILTCSESTGSIPA